MSQFFAATNDSFVGDERVLTISELTEQIKSCLQSHFSSLWVAGEISDLARPQSGHIYFTLKDATAQLRAVMWRQAALRLPMPLEDGMQVICQGEIDIYPPRGSYQLIVRRLHLQGEGALQQALRKLQARLAAEGLFAPERKRPLPRYPQRIAVVTSPTGAAIRDFLEVARRRWKGTEMIIVPTRVQGAQAAVEIVQAIRDANRLPMPIDTLVVTRGGGSMEDLWCFNDEAVVRAIAASRIPVVAAIGHEIDVTLADLAADVRALTPSEAAERVLPSRQDVVQSLAHWSERLTQCLLGKLQRARTRLDALANRRSLTRPELLLQLRAQRLDELSARADRAIARRLETQRLAADRLQGKLESLSPLAVLRRGYSLTRRADSGQLVRHAQDVQPGDWIQSRVAEAEIVSRVEQVTPVEAVRRDNPSR